MSFQGAKLMLNIAGEIAQYEMGWKLVFKNLNYMQTLQLFN